MYPRGLGMPVVVMHKRKAAGSTLFGSALVTEPKEQQMKQPRPPWTSL